MASEAGLSLLQIAAVLKSNGTEGEVLFGFKTFSPEEIDTQEPVFIYHDGLPVPYFIESFTPRGNSKALVRLTGIESLEDAEEISGKEVYGRCSDYEIEGEDDPSALVGWTVLDADGKTAGTISGYEDIPGNLCLYIKTPSGKEAMVPFREELIIAYNEASENITLDIPDGLLNL